ncbi:MAG: hypothetical protein JSV34_00790, partial [Candidatus Omnitrophota bacterium]
KKLEDLKVVVKDYDELKVQSQKDLVRLNSLQEGKQKYQKLLAQSKAQLENKFNKEIKALKDISNQYKISLDEANSRLKEANLKNIEYSGRINNLQETMQFLKQGYVSLEKEKELFAATKEDQLKETAALKENNENLKNTFIRKEQMFNDTIEKFQEREKRFRNILDELKKANINKEKYISKIKSLNEETSLLENKINNLQEENNIFVKKMQNLQNTVKDYETKKQQNQKYLATIDVLQKEIDKYNRLFSRYKKSGNVTQITGRNQQLKERICYLEEKCDTLENEKEELVKSFETKKFYESVSLKKENARLRRVLAEMTSRFESHQQDQEQKHYSGAQSLK